MIGDKEKWEELNNFSHIFQEKKVMFEEMKTILEKLQDKFSIQNKVKIQKLEDLQKLKNILFTEDSNYSIDVS